MNDTSATEIEKPKAKRVQSREKMRSDGAGSVYREGDRFVAAISLGIVDGKRAVKRVRFKTKREADQHVARMRVDLDAGIRPGDDRTTLRAFLERWLREKVDSPSSSLRPSTRASYTHQVRCHLAPGLGHHPIGKLRAEHVDAFINAKLRSGLSPRTVQYLRATLRVALKAAKKWGLVAHNAAADADSPKVPKVEARYLTHDEQDRLFAALSKDRRLARHLPLFRLALALGLRRGEVVGLKWEHLDLEAGLLHVTEQVQRVKGQGLVAQDLKTERSRRTIKLPPSVAGLLREAERAQKAERARRVLKGKPWEDRGYVFTTREGKPMDGHNVWRAFKLGLEKAGLPVDEISFHATRHTAASAVGSCGVLAVMALLGHSQHSTALRYTHTTDALLDAVAGAVESGMRRPGGA